jgi:hypothetical protein
MESMALQLKNKRMKQDKNSQMNFMAHLLDRR